MNEYVTVLNEIKKKVQQDQLNTVLSANQYMLFLYWTMGNYIIKHQQEHGWGAKIIPLLADDFKKAFPVIKGFSIRNLMYMKKFAEAYPIAMLQTFNQVEEELNAGNTFSQDWSKKFDLTEKQDLIIEQQVAAQQRESIFIKSIVAKITWSHHIILLDKVSEPAKQFWYMLNTIEHGNGRNILSAQIDSNLFEKELSAKKITCLSKTAPKPETDFATYIMKDPFIFDFVQAKQKADERNIKQQLTDHIIKFLVGLDKGFAFIGKQVHIEIGGQDFYIDLLLYHIRLHAYVVVELKARDFQPEDTGKLNFYINVVNDKLKGPGDSDTIGMLLCKGKNEVMAEYALKGIGHPIGVAEYQLAKAIPEALKSQLPDISDLENELN